MFSDASMSDQRNILISFQGKLRASRRLVHSGAIFGALRSWNCRLKGVGEGFRDSQSVHGMGRAPSHSPISFGHFNLRILSQGDG